MKTQLGKAVRVKSPHCRGAPTIIAAIVDPGVIAKILRSLGLPSQAPLRSPAQTLDFVQTA